MPYHDDEWGRPVTDDVRLFEKLCLEGFQAGLAWITILRKREHFRAAFAGFDPERVAAFGERDVERLLGDAGIVRHRGKIEAAIGKRRLQIPEQGALAGEKVCEKGGASPRARQSIGKIGGKTMFGHGVATCETISCGVSSNKRGPELLLQHG